MSTIKWTRNCPKIALKLNLRLFYTNPFICECFCLLCLKIKGENIATPSRYIFVFVNEVLKINKYKKWTSVIFRIWHTKVKVPPRFSPKYLPEKYLHPSSQNTSQSLRGYKTKRKRGRQRKSSRDTRSSPRPQLEHWKKSGVKYAAFLPPSFFATVR